MGERYDVAIIGTGPAGLSAAITAKIRNKRILLIGSKDLSPKVQKAHTIKNYLGLPDIGGEELGKRFAEHLENMQIEPDILVYNDPASVLRGEDKQLEAAVAEMLKTIDNK